MDTKHRILEEALNLFAVNGYDATSVEQIAGAVGIKAPSLYKHYKGKEAIFLAVMDEMNVRYDGQTEKLNMNGRIVAEDGKIFSKSSSEQIEEIGLGLFLYFLHDSYAMRFRKMLTLGQYKNHDLAAIFDKQYVNDPLQYQTGLFMMLIQTNIFCENDPQIMALQFYAPIYFLMTWCDREPQKEQEAILLLKKHIRQFSSIYKQEEK